MTDVENAVAEIVAATDPPGKDGVSFDAPWQARAFAMTVALRREDDFPWEAFQRRLVEELADEADERGDDATRTDVDLESRYYEAWLSAFERLLLDTDVVGSDEFAERAAEFASGERDASEFVVGDRGHDHGHSHSHDHGRGHDEAE